MGKKFECVAECAECCIRREYYPGREFGKIGVLLLPGEVSRINELAARHRVDITILPRIAVSNNRTGRKKIIAYQLMGSDKNGDTCPFLDRDSKSPHGGYACRIYEERPLACRAYPLIGSSPITIDEKCSYCTECGVPDSGLEDEMEALAEIAARVDAADDIVWRFATAVGDADAKMMTRGWVLEDNPGIRKRDRDNKTQQRRTS